MERTAMIQVLGAVAYGEWKAYEGAKAKAAEATTEADRKAYRKIAAEELRHHKGFVARLEAMGADPDRAMAPYREPLDRYHGRSPSDPVEDAMFGYLGEGVADDLLRWLRKVVDADTAAFIDAVMEDEAEHEARAAAELRELLASTPGGRSTARRAARTMHGHMIGSGAAGNPLPFAAFLRLGRPHELVAAVVGGQIRRLRTVLA